MTKHCLSEGIISLGVQGSGTVSWEGKGTHMISAHPSQVERGSFTPLPWILSFERKICVMMLPNLPAPAERPTHVARYFVGKTSAVICAKLVRCQFECILLVGGWGRSFFRSRDHRLARI